MLGGGAISDRDRHTRRSCTDPPRRRHRPALDGRACRWLHLEIPESPAERQSAPVSPHGLVREMALPVSRDTPRMAWNGAASPTPPQAGIPSVARQHRPSVLGARSKPRSKNSLASEKAKASSATMGSTYDKPLAHHHLCLEGGPTTSATARRRRSSAIYCGDSLAAPAHQVRGLSRPNFKSRCARTLLPT